MGLPRLVSPHSSQQHSGFQHAVIAQWIRLRLPSFHLESHWLENCPYYNSRVVIYEHRPFIRMAAGLTCSLDGVLVSERLGRWFLINEPDRLTSRIPGSEDDPSRGFGTRFKDFSAQGSSELAGAEDRDNERLVRGLHGLQFETRGVLLVAVCRKLFFGVHFSVAVVGEWRGVVRLGLSCSSSNSKQCNWTKLRQIKSVLTFINISTYLSLTHTHTSPSSSLFCHKPDIVYLFVTISLGKLNITKDAFTQGVLRGVKRTFRQ